MADDFESASTTAYTSMKRIGENRVILSYERLGNGWGGAPGRWGDTDSVFTIRLRMV